MKKFLLFCGCLFVFSSTTAMIRAGVDVGPNGYYYDENGADWYGPGYYYGTYYYDYPTYNAWRRNYYYGGPYYYRRHYHRGGHGHHHGHKHGHH